MRNTFSSHPDFARWFGDSRVVAPSGAPLIVYHSTDATFTTFDVTKARSYSGEIDYELPGFYFSADRQTSSEYGGRIMAVYLSLLNPFIGDLHDFKQSRGLNTWRAVRDELIKEGFDGVIEDEEGDGLNVEYIALHAEQIKTVTTAPKLQRRSSSGPGM